MRGAQHFAEFAGVGEGIIPADAGSTTACPAALSHAPDHPRRCGEHKSVDLAVLGGAGSSPQMRGALAVESIAVVVVGIIPADAGSTSG